MSAFKFDLQKVLNVRNIEEDMAQNKFLKAKEEKKEIEKSLENLKETKKDVHRYIRNNSSVEQILHARRFLQKHDEKIENHQQKLSAKKREVTEKQKEMLAKQKKRKVLDKLKERKYKTFYKEKIKDQQKELDEIAQHEGEER
ncbi:MAG TPA: flagellar export protein FliJ [Halanaerobiales bacterium]|nr:flagellar export protein FliJ [Halanaerobiales bacterium]